MREGDFFGKFADFFAEICILGLDFVGVVGYHTGVFPVQEAILMYGLQLSV